MILYVYKVPSTLEGGIIFLQVLFYVGILMINL